MDMTVRIQIAALILYLLVCCVCGQDTCKNGQFGDDCLDCRCLNGHDYCDSSNGSCTDNLCSRGWTGTDCQTACQPNIEWGVNCAKLCHCGNGIECSPINGVCNGPCATEWSGPSCMIRLTQMTDAPMTSSDDCNVIIIKWRSWQEDIDYGDPPVKSYTVQMMANQSSWNEIEIIYVTDESQSQYNYSYEADSQDTYFSFRITANREKYDKPVDGIPGPPSVARSLADMCAQTTSDAMTTVAMTTIATDTIESTTHEAPGQSMSATSPPIEETTVLDGLTPVQNLKVISNDTTGYLRVSWTPPLINEDIAAFKVSYQIIGIGNCDDNYTRGAKTDTVSPLTTIHTITSTLYWRKYLIGVAAVTTANEYTQWAESTVQSKETIPSGTVKNLKFANTTETSFSITWDELECSKRGGTGLYYRVHVWKLKDQTQEQVTMEDVYGLRFTIKGLEPLQLYGVRICAANSKGLGAYTDDYRTVTQGQVNLAPSNLETSSSTESSILISWTPPSYPLHLIQEYNIVYQQLNSNVVKTVRVAAISSSPQWNVTNLQPLTEYSFKIKAETDQGWGPLSQSLTANTLQSYPSAPTQLKMEWRDENCIRISWRVPNSVNGPLMAYMVEYMGDNFDTSSEVLSGQTQNSMCALSPATQYTIRVSAKNSRGYGPAVSISASTEIKDPEIPNTPVLRFIRETTITIQIQPSVLSGGPVSGYFIIISTERSKRSLQDPVSTLGLSGYTTAFLTPEEVTRSRSFVIGDGQHYGGYHNRPLEDDTDYTIYYVVASSLDGVTKMSFAEIPTTAHTKKITAEKTTMPSIPSSTEPPSEGSNSHVILGIVLGCVLAILAIVIIVVVLYCVRKRKARYQQSDGKNYNNWLSYYTDHFYNSSQSEQVSFSKTYSMSEVDGQNSLASYNQGMDPLNNTSISVSELHHHKPKVNYEAEYQKLPQGNLFPCKAAKLSANKEKNRFDHILPYDHSRVVLRHRAHDYINASYIDGYDAPRAYISAQSPFDDESINALWHMVHQENVTQIVFMARLVEDGVVKCVPYWPQKTSKEYGLLKVHLVSTETFTNFNVYHFDIEPLHRKKRRVVQYQFSSWPDHGIPADCIGFLEFLRKVRCNTRKGSGPLLVHCGTGVSRSAVFIAVDALLKQARVESEVNVMEFCKKMRQNRTMMVRTLKQYSFIYDIIMEALLINYSMVGTDLKNNYRLLSEENPVTKKSHFADQFEILEKFVPGLTAEKCKSGLKKENCSKNRFNCMDLLPPDANRPVLKPVSNGRTDYINAVYLDSYVDPKAFIMTQSPLISTLVDFWQLVYDNQVRTIVMLDGQHLKDDTCPRYWPNGDPPEQNYGPFTVSLVSEEQHDLVTIRSLRLHCSEKNETRLLYQLQCEGWKPGNSTPQSREPIMEMIELAEGSQCEHNSNTAPPIVVHCMNGATRSGLFCACFTMSEILRLERQVDIFHTIKRIKTLRPKAISNLEQYKFCFKFLWDFMQTRLRKRKIISRRE